MNYQHEINYTYCNRCGDDSLVYDEICEECDRPEDIMINCYLCDNDIDYYDKEDYCDIYLNAINIIIKKYKKYKIKQLLLKTCINLDIINNIVSYCL